MDKNKYILLILFEGLASILFAINIDNPSLNTIKQARGIDVLLPSPPQTSKPFPARVDSEPRPVIAGEGRFKTCLVLN